MDKPIKDRLKAEINEKIDNMNTYQLQTALRIIIDLKAVYKNPKK